jgi:hypothetical protein
MREANLTLSFTDVASLIAPADTPPWLAPLLRNWAPSLMIDRQVHAAQPTNTKMLRVLSDVSNAATVLRRALAHAPTKEFLELEGGIQIANAGGLDHVLRAIGERAAVAAASPRIAAMTKTKTRTKKRRSKKTKTQAKRGRSRALPTNATSPKTFCAIIISEIWKQVHDEYPAPRNIKAAAAAEAYWRASGGVAAREGSEPHSSWRHHFKKAKLRSADRLRQEIRRHCIEHSRWYSDV